MRPRRAFDWAIRNPSRSTNSISTQGAEVATGLSSLKAAFDIAKGLNALSDAVALNDAKIGLQGAILEAQSGLLAAQEAQTANLRRVGELEDEIVRLKDWLESAKTITLWTPIGAPLSTCPRLAGRTDSQPIGYARTASLKGANPFCYLRVRM